MKSLQNFQPMLGLLEVPKVKAKIKTRYCQFKKTYSPLKHRTYTWNVLRVEDDSETLEKAELMIKRYSERRKQTKEKRIYKWEAIDYFINFK